MKINWKAIGVGSAIATAVAIVIGVITKNKVDDENTCENCVDEYDEDEEVDDIDDSEEE